MHLQCHGRIHEKRAQKSTACARDCGAWGWTFCRNNLGCSLSSRTQLSFVSWTLDLRCGEFWARRPPGPIWSWMALRAFYSQTSCGCIGRRMREKDGAHRSHPSSDFGGLLELSSDVGPGIGQRCTYMMSLTVRREQLFRLEGSTVHAICPAAVFSPESEVSGYLCKHTFAPGWPVGTLKAQRKSSLRVVRFWRRSKRRPALVSLSWRTLVERTVTRVGRCCQYLSLDSFVHFGRGISENRMKDTRCTTFARWTKIHICRPITSTFNIKSILCQQITGCYHWDKMAAKYSVRVS